MAETFEVKTRVLTSLDEQVLAQATNEEVGNFFQKGIFPEVAVLPVQEEEA